MSLLSALLDLIFPAKCPFCGRVLDRPGICGTCRGELPWTEGADALRRGPGGFLCAAPLWYQGLAREGLHRFKFRGMSSAAAPLGELIAGCAAEHFSGAFDTVTWVPVSPRRLRQRGPGPPAGGERLPPVGDEAAAAAAQDRPQPRPVGTEGSCRPPGQCAGGL